jgi:hypothetical protein
MVPLREKKATLEDRKIRYTRNTCEGAPTCEPDCVRAHNTVEDKLVSRTRKEGNGMVDI